MFICYIFVFGIDIVCYSILPLVFCVYNIVCVVLWCLFDLFQHLVIYRQGYLQKLAL